MGGGNGLVAPITKHCGHGALTGQVIASNYYCLALSRNRNPPSNTLWTPKGAFGLKWAPTGPYGSPPRENPGETPRRSASIFHDYPAEHQASEQYPHECRVNCGISGDNFTHHLAQMYCIMSVTRKVASTDPRTTSQNTSETAQS